MSTAISLVRLLGRDADPTKGREHVQLSVLAKRRMHQGRPRSSAPCPTRCSAHPSGVWARSTCDPTRLLHLRELAPELLARYP